MTLLQAHGLTKIYGKKVAVNHVDLNVEAGKLIAFLGPNGAGKSTTINMLTGTISPTAGTVLLGERQPNQRDYQKHIGVVFQNSVLDGNLTVWENLKSRAGMYQDCQLTPKSTLIVEFGLANILNQKYETLSGGQRRRVDIARALLHHPDVLFLDEPSTGLDIQTRTKIWQILDHLRLTTGLTIILTTHYLEEANSADFVYVIDKGKVLAGDTLDNLKQQYAPYLLMIETTQPEQVLAKVKPEWLIEQHDSQINIRVKDELTAIKFLNQVQTFISHFECRSGNIDDIFMTLTGKEIR